MRKKIAGKKQYKKLTRSQEFELMRTLYACGPDRPFESEKERRDAWNEHRDEMLAKCHSGSRPGAFWTYDRPDIDALRIPFEDDDQLLYRMNMLTDLEIEQLKDRGIYPPKPADGRDPRYILDE